ADHRPDPDLHIVRRLAQLLVDENRGRPVAAVFHRAAKSADIVSQRIGRKTMNDIRLLKTLPVANALGECVLWNGTEQAFYWTDIPERKLYRWHPDTDRLAQWNTPERLCSFGFVEGDDRT